MSKEFREAVTGQTVSVVCTLKASLLCDQGLTQPVLSPTPLCSKQEEVVEEE